MTEHWNFLRRPYRPLHRTLTVKESDIEGLGIFATEDIPALQGLGESHVMSKFHPNGYIRTPLGGFLNHSDTPNARKVMIGTSFFVVTLRDIKEGEEITVRYSMYEVETEN